MPNFWDLPRPVRDQVYRLHLVYDEPITQDQHDMTMYQRISHKRCMPAICYLDKKTEKEAAPIYYGENHFDLGNISHIQCFSGLLESTFPRHLKLIKKITCNWVSTSDSSWVPSHVSTGKHYGGYGLVRDNFVRLSKLKGLKELDIRLDEAEMIRCLGQHREHRQKTVRMALTPQQQLAILRMPGINGILSLSNVPLIRFLKLKDKDGKEVGGPMEGGPLENIIQPRLHALRTRNKRTRRKAGFRFLDLPAELRNRVYDLVLRIPGLIHPSTEPPTSAPKNKDCVKLNESSNHESALSLLVANKQIYQEAVGVFYNANAFVFYYPTQLNVFLSSLGPQRQSLISDLTIYYHNLKIGGVNLVDLTFPLLKQLRGLKKLHIIMASPLRETTLRIGWLQRPWHYSIGQRPLSIRKANPVSIPGIRALFDLRGVIDIKIRDVELENKVEELQEEAGYPAFPNNEHHRIFMQLHRAYEHFNAALRDAQAGNVNWELLADDEWHMKEVFPSLQKEEEATSDAESEEVGSDSEFESDDDSDSDYEDT